MSTKTIVSICMAVGMTIGGLLPWVFGDHSLLDGWGILGGLVGGFVGIWVGATLGRKLR